MTVLHIDGAELPPDDDDGEPATQVQIARLASIVEQHRGALAEVRALPGVERMVDLGVTPRKVAVQVDVYPAPLLAALGALEIDLMISTYLVALDGADDESSAA